MSQLRGNQIKQPVNFTGSLEGTSSWAKNALNAINVSIDSGSFATTGSNTFFGPQTISGSLVITGALTATSSFASSSSFAITALTASYVRNAETASYTVSASNAISTSFATTAQTASYVLNAVSASFVTTAQTASYVQNTISSSFATTAQTASYVQNAISASYASTASYVLNAVSASFAQRSNTASFASTAQTASYVQNAISSSFAQRSNTASFATNAATSTTAISAGSAGSATTALYALTASYINPVSIPVPYYDYTNITLLATPQNVGDDYVIIQPQTGTIPDLNINDTIRFESHNTIYQIQTVDYNYGYQAQVHFSPELTQDVSTTGDPAAVFLVKKLEILTAGYGLYITSSSVDSSVSTILVNTEAIATTTGYNIFQDDQYISGSVTATNGFIGTASYANYALTSIASTSASYVQNAISSSFATTASYVLNAVSASFASTAQTASYVLNSVSSSFASTASYVQNAISSSFATTASYVLNAVSASFAQRSNTASFASTAQTASYVLNSVSSSFASTAQTASYVLNSVSSSFASTASYVQNAISSSFATTASYVLNAVSASFASNASFATNAATSTTAISAGSAGSATTASYALTASYIQSDLTRTFYSRTSPTTTTGSGEQVLMSGSIPANALVPGGQLQIHAKWRVNATSTNTKIFRIKLNTFAIRTVTFTTTAQLGLTEYFTIELSSSIATVATAIIAPPSTAIFPFAVTTSPGVYQNGTMGNLYTSPVQVSMTGECVSGSVSGSETLTLLSARIDYRPPADYSYSGGTFVL